MKNYEEMAKLVLEARDEYVKKKKKRVLFLKRASLVTLGAAAVLGIGLFTHAMKPLKNPSFNQSGIIVETETTLSEVVTTEKHFTDTDFAQTSTSTTASNTHTMKQTSSATTIALTISTRQITATTTITIINDDPQTSSDSMATEFATEPTLYDPYDLTNRFLRFRDTDTNTQYTKTSVDIPYEIIDKYIRTTRLKEKTSLEGAEFECDINIFSLSGIPSEAMIAVQYDDNDKYTLYRNQEYKADTFYELIESFAIDKFAQLQSIEYYDIKDGGALYELNNDDNVYRELFLNNHDAELVDYYSLLPDDINPDIKVICSYMNSNSFTITFGISSKGYITTNVTGKGVAYYIGENNSEKIIKMAIKDKQ